MVLQIIVLVGPAVTLGLIAADKKLMGKHYLNGYNKIIYWGIVFLIFGTGVASLVYLI
jgi:Mn2+/Fe2+ NRAMP family transporter